jgi:hypothetical protein
MHPGIPLTETQRKSLEVGAYTGGVLGLRHAAGIHPRQQAAPTAPTAPSGVGEGGSADDYKESYQRPSRDKRVGLGARYAQAMRVAEDELRNQGVSEDHLRAAAAIMVGAV